MALRNIATRGRPVAVLLLTAFIDRSPLCKGMSSP
jgi:hypothetical protein